MKPTPPVANRLPSTRLHHGDEFVDDLEWLRDKGNPEVIANLEAENDYTAQVTAHQQGLRDEIFAEIKNRTVETDLSVPVRRFGWWYYSRTQEGKQYPIHCRTPVIDEQDWTPPTIDANQRPEATPDNLEQILIDCNEAAEGQPFFALGGLTVTGDGSLLAFSQDTTGDERLTLKFKDLTTQRLLDEVIENVNYDLAWNPAGDTIFYTLSDDAWRPYQVLAHRLGTPTSSDRIIFTEDDVTLRLDLALSSDRQELLVTSSSPEYRESWSLDLDDPEAELQLLIPRDLRLLHSLDPFDGENGREYFITHNFQARNNMISLAPGDQLGTHADPASWTTITDHQEDVKIEGTAITRTHLAVALRKDTTPRVEFFALSDLTSPVEPAFGEELATISLIDIEYDSPVARLGYTSFLTPDAVYDYVLESKELVVRKQTPVRGGYDRTKYEVSREWAKAEDGTLIPVSIIRLAGLRPDGTNPCIVYGYGSYEVSTDPGFAVSRLSLLDRGVVFAVAHTRGGGELGRQWYEGGRKLAKKNTFTDFIAATRHLISAGWADPTRIGALGGSAGGLLIGAVLNLAPELYRVAVAQVPFVDSLTTILDPDLPLSAYEWEEWGNPITDPEVYACMRSYSPYENIRPVPYPMIAAVTSLNDIRVLYVEPAKWVQRLREVTTGEEPIVLKTEMDGGHGGASGRYEAWKDRAWDYAFLLSALGIKA